ncbi:GntR family transcriptional regulator [Auritidibacter sp. NML100628]|uniref:GntR family transcriptional regulator n=1 Tax=Auritidibacter sp. NML100628 TaxID=2170742 RepID=UPI000D72B385|nr:GntR family transcriptional regulator [Auritidibacter sp. NML100628]PXA76990.1 GntR family transcriptional regulator [Auritidibacter sp. NML100628]
MPTSRTRSSKPSEAMTWVRQQILSGAITPGEVVRPEEVGRTLHISTTPAREALQTLTAEGFLSAKPGHGFVVEILSADDIRDIFTVHSFLAGEIAARAVAHAKTEDIDELEALHYELLACAKRKLWSEVEDRNHQFHRKITLLADSPKMAKLLGIVSRYVPRAFYPEVEGWVTASADDHAAIIDSFRNNQPEKARAAMSEHIKHAGQLLAEQFDKTQRND